MAGRPLRIAIDGRKLRDFGIGTHLAGLLVGLLRCASDEELHVLLAPEDERALAGSDLPPALVAALASPRFSTARSSAAKYGLAEHLALPWAARRAGARVFHTPHWVLPALAPRASLVTIHDLVHLRFPEQLPHAAARAFARVWLPRAYRRARVVLTVSEYTKGELLEWLGGDPERIVVAPNALDERYLGPAPALAPPVPGPYVLYVGNDKPHKNLGRLVEAFAALAREERELALVVTGAPASAAERLGESARSLGIEERLHFAGRLSFDALHAAIAGARALVLPSLHEGFGLPPLEAMACGTPAVVARAGALPEVCSAAAVYVDPLDADSIAEGMARALRDEPLRARLVAAGRERALLFGPEPLARATLAAYHRAAEA